MPRRLFLMLLYMAIIFGVVVIEIHYARNHPIVDQKPPNPAFRKAPDHAFTK